MAVLTRGRLLGSAATAAVAILLVSAGFGRAIADNDAEGRRAAMALLRVYTAAPGILSDDPPGAAQDPEAFRNTMAALAKSHFVIASALRPQAIAEIEQIRSVENPVQWVRDRLDVGFLENSEVMQVRLFDDTMAPADLEKLVDSLVDSFMREVVDDERIERMRDLDSLRQMFDRASQDLNRQRQEFFELSEALGGADSPTGNLRQEMLLESWRANRAERRELQKQLAEAYMQHQFELVEAGALVYPDESQEDDSDEDSPDADRAANLQPRKGALVATDTQELDVDTRQDINRSRARFAIIRQVSSTRLQSLDGEADEMTARIEEYSKESAQVQSRREQLQRRAELVDVMGKKLARWELEQGGGSRVELIQQAVIERASGD